ncbi:TBC1 domain family member 22A [Platysternon megacephalum]|uniref:TBC1 domain family member 22A n=1 Tax=Platysternon megacephalum TaxID=55544 RepID=A0A4D9EGB6_9SAUR|nr:TBC1 domain family member 22A [Platysternon megacephalum]
MGVIPFIGRRAQLPFHYFVFLLESHRLRGKDLYFDCPVLQYMKCSVAGTVNYFVLNFMKSESCSTKQYLVGTLKENCTVVGYELLMVREGKASKQVGNPCLATRCHLYSMSMTI